jgi:serine protease Do
MPTFPPRLAPFAVLCRVLAFAVVLAAAPALARGAPESFAPLVKQVLPSVVNIAVTETVAGPDPFAALPPELQRQFRDRFRNRRQQVAGAGSGYIVDPSGIIVTNNHVVDKAKKVTVRLESGKEIDATVVGVDAKTDLAVIKIDPKLAPVSLKWGDSDKSRVGDSVFAVGSPFGLGNTVTAGIISARSRDIHSGPYDDYFQVDAPINQGNSGGPLLNAEGHVIGVNSAIYSPSGGNVGIGFSIPSAQAQAVASQIIAHGSVERGWLGVGIQDVTPDIAKSFGIAEDKGVLVGEVTPNSPAAKAGIKPQDVILSFGDRAIKDRHDLTRAVADTKAGASKDLKILRDGRQQTISVKIAALDDTPAKEKVKLTTDSASKLQGKVPLSGLGLQLADGDDGLVIADVAVNSAAADAQLRPGDKLVMVNQTPVKTASEAQRAVADAKQKHRDAVLLQIDRNGTKAFIGVPFSGS